MKSFPWREEIDAEVAKKIEALQGKLTGDKTHDFALIFQAGIEFGADMMKDLMDDQTKIMQSLVRSR